MRGLTYVIHAYLSLRSLKDWTGARGGVFLLLDKLVATRAHAFFCEWCLPVPSNRSARPPLPLSIAAWSATAGDTASHARIHTVQTRLIHVPKRGNTMAAVTSCRHRADGLYFLPAESECSSDHDS